jgi:hypothetical protein
MNLNPAAVSQVSLHMSTRAAPVCRGLRFLGGSVSDVLYIGLIIVVFAALWLLVRGVDLIGGILLTIYLFAALVLPERF